MNSGDLLSVIDLAVEVGRGERRMQAVRGASFAIARGARLGLVGESGSGKTLTALSILLLLPPTANVVSGSVQFDGCELLALTDREMNRVRGRDISMAFQNAHASLNPLFTAGQQIADVFQFHRSSTSDEAWKKTVQLLGDLSMPEPENAARAYPHELSGGMAQRAMLAMALISDPQLLIADEPTSGLDPTVQVDVLDVLSAQVTRTGLSVMLISHDITAVVSVCTHVAVMRAGEIVETGPLDDVFARPRHPYTQELLASSLAIAGITGPSEAAI